MCLKHIILLSLTTGLLDQIYVYPMMCLKHQCFWMQLWTLSSLQFYS